MPPSRSSVPKRRRLPKEYNKKPCPICGETVKYVRDVERHKLTHAPNKEELKVRCPVSDCDYATLQKSNITVHVRTQQVRPSSRSKGQVYHCQPSCTFCALEWMELAEHQINVHDINHNIEELEKLALASKEKLPEPLPAVPNAIVAATDHQKPSRKRAPKTKPRPTTAPRHDLEVAPEDAINATYQYGEYAPNDGSNLSSFPGWLPHNQAQLVCDGSLPGYSTGYNTAYFQGQLQTRTESFVGNTLQSTWNPILQATSQTSGYPMGYNSYYSQGLLPNPFVRHPMGLPPQTWDAVLQNTPQSSSQASPVTPYDGLSGSLPSYHYWSERQKLFPSASVNDVDLNALGDITSRDFTLLDPNFEFPDGNGQLSTPRVQDPEFCTF
ncbi:hypothetical protein M378DRAFT_11001 [Amanita muscaria Koide BX008]|uniref:C2H2-type domain-containing protein n=1 Tax=Amanita muscaria (strain Koide BX008) TaxID=946122 RepID=A0A0C2TE79_AMAMK|nr:hypothetical protein M378DRAFT_11001 [Amanita muscaria Koide BX008]